ncbi:hypothetical protein J2X36_004625 [Methylobacterium sp. BE186]|uniref:DUF6894 family protein n=1 Tax=Methylobacterium sp. BE186 TaxID=2817715 RepID=UPI00285DB9DE|nr:hypothetical protein [Methylobacterium sp. BE186]MDR7039847.1 hypothetical protein [Methylobacterium sp. BE186]
MPASRADIGSVAARTRSELHTGECQSAIVRQTFVRSPADLECSKREWPMPWFYFHLRTPAGLERDDIGLELIGIEAAYLDACQAIPTMAADLSGKKVDPRRCRFEIADSAGRALLEVPFTEILDKGRRPSHPALLAQRRKATAEMERAARLIEALGEERAALLAELQNLRELLAHAQEVSSHGTSQRRT